ncbi:hypothetical protein Tco_0918952 [Tanacetum coccineum]
MLNDPTNTKFRPRNLKDGCWRNTGTKIEEEYGYQANDHGFGGIRIQKVYKFKRFLDKLNDDDVIAVSHEDAKNTLGDTNDPFTSISMSKDFADKDISANDAY